jgi:hypothetical protein
MENQKTGNNKFMRVGAPHLCLTVRGVDT